MEIIENYWWMLLLAIICIVLYFRSIKREKDIDSITDYSQEDLGGKFFEQESGETWLVYPYQLTQQNKKKFILNSIKQYMEIDDEYGYTFIISKLISHEYYDTVTNSQGVVKKTGGPYVVYKVIPKTEKSDSGINVTGNNGPVNITTGEGTATQSIINSTFSNKMEEFRDIMINHGILEEDIDVIINYPNNEKLKESFLTRYGLDLAKITVKIAGVATSLLEIFSN